ncbi:MlaD family protein [Conexibacter sp. SYSU D00693]|uniref:MlaD family protein n=1 Tax=Conexibacter sp. SYSU D00693 TaxID=2812560 RepID=UPI00196AFEAA|nr:MlaD family protein [Conexibacter sp. SYSU D00693]
MRRLAWLAPVLAAAVVGALVLAGGGQAQTNLQDGPPTGSYRVDAIFDTAKGIVPGQTVKVAGARVGEVQDVVLTPDHRARIQLRVDGRFGPFREDARCEIQPEGLLSENFVQCDPGTPSAAALVGRGDEVPTVALERTAVPVNLTDLFEVWEVPVRDRLRVLLTTLGAGAAARGPDLNEVLQRANPTLGLVKQAVETLDAQRDDLLAATSQTHRLTRELARDPQRIGAFVDEAGAVARVTARRSAELRAGVRSLPPLLAALRPALARVDRLATAGGPLADELREGAPAATQLLTAIPPAARAAGPAVRSLGVTAGDGRAAVRDARPLAGRLGRFAAAAVPTGDELERLLASAVDQDVIRHLLSFVYRAAAATSRFDRTSHLLPSGVVINTCGLFANETKTACDANYTREHHETRSRARRRGPRGDRPRRPAAPAAPPAAPAPVTTPTPQTTTQTPAPTTPLPQVVEPVRDVVKGAERLLDLLLGQGR